MHEKKRKTAALDSPDERGAFLAPAGHDENDVLEMSGVVDDDGDAWRDEAGAGDLKRAKKKKKKKGKKPEQVKEVPASGSARGIETLFRTSYRTNMDLSSLADTKANIMISINGIIISIILASISPKIDANPWLILPTTVLLLSCLVSIVYAVLSARPRVHKNVITLEEVRNNTANILFFGNFVSLREREYIVGMKELLQNSDTLREQMIKDIYGLGLVLIKKYELLRVSYTVFMFGLISGVLLFNLVYLWVVLFPPARGGSLVP
ncbi:MAG: DUF5706 domain-containing protein [Rhodothermales bacterium]|nr:DUF5706 domain-containing protein [Rhodothermales bacterium]